MGKKKSKQNKQRINAVVRSTTGPEQPDRLGDFLAYVRVVMFFIAAVFLLYKYTNVFDYMGLVSRVDPAEKYVEQAERDRLEIIAQCELYKEYLSREVRTDLLLASKFVHRMFRKYLSLGEYNEYAMLEYDAEYRKRTVDEFRRVWYYLEKVKREMTPKEKADFQEVMKVLDRVNIELKEIKSKMLPNPKKE